MFMSKLHCYFADDSKTHDLQFLPPITLHFQLPQDYPSSKPPQFTLSCKWLTEPQVLVSFELQNISW